MSYRLLVLFCLAALCAFARAEGNPPPTARAVLNKLGEDLASAWRAYPSDKQKEARDAQVKKASDVFNRDIGNATPTPNLSVDRAIDAYLDYVDGAKEMFKGEKLKAPRDTYLAACQTVFKKESASATDLNDARPAQQCFEQLMTLLKNAQAKLSLSDGGTKNRIYGDINGAMEPLFKHAKYPDKGDPIEQHEQNLKEIQSKIPSAGEAGKSNQPIIGILQDRAKQIRDRSKQ